MLVQATQALAGLEALFHRPPGPGDRTRVASGHRVGHPAAGEGQLPGLAVAADQQPVLAVLPARRRIVVVVEADEHQSW
jgi:hypothetical protein